MLIGLSTFSRRIFRPLIVLAALSVVSFAAHAGLDHKLAFDQSGIWNRNVQLAVEYSAIAVAGGGALWLGTDTELGQTFWQSVDAEAIYSTLEKSVVPMFYDRDKHGVPQEWVKMMKRSMESVCSRFSSHRMVAEYTEHFYWPAHS